MRKIHILLVEDNEGDILLTTEALENSPAIHQISVIRDGVEAIEFLDRKGRYAGAGSPDLILLDINLPRRNGLEVLEHVKTSELLKQIPVIMLTTSSADKDIQHCYRNHANCYITKPMEASPFVEVLSSVEHFWAQIVQLPLKN